MILYQCSSHFDSSKKMAARGRGLFSLYIYIENFKNLLVRNHWTDFHIILQKCSFGDPLPRLFRPFGFVKNMAARGRGIFSLYIYIENFKNLLVQNHWAGSSSVAQLDVPSDWRPGGRGFNTRQGRQHSFVEIDHEIFSTVILSLPLIQEGQLSVSGERMCTILVNRLED